ncbi:hypothetical protein SDJN02_01299, partial [Cucurbita argyrosperma subsp. argyrosperma]
MLPFSCIQSLSLLSCARSGWLCDSKEGFAANTRTRSATSTVYDCLKTFSYSSVNTFLCALDGTW